MCSGRDKEEETSRRGRKMKRKKERMHGNNTDLAAAKRDRKEKNTKEGGKKTQKIWRRDDFKKIGGRKQGKKRFIMPVSFLFVVEGEQIWSFRLFHLFGV